MNGTLPATEVPQLETQRLVLREHRLLDFPYLEKIWADPKVVEHITGEPSTSQQSWTRFLTYVGHWPVMGFGIWAVEEKSTASYIGHLGFANFQRGLEKIGDKPEAGWVLSSHVHGKGYATEGMTAALKWAQDGLPSKEIACIINVGNVASIRVAEKCGFKRTGQTEYLSTIVNVYEQTLV